MTHTERQGPHHFPTPPPSLAFLYFGGYNLIAHPLQPAVTLSGILTLCTTVYGTRPGGGRYGASNYVIYCMGTKMGTSESSVIDYYSSSSSPPPSEWHISPLLFGLGLVQRYWRAPLDAMRLGGSSRCIPGIEVDDTGLFGVPSSAHLPHFPSTPISPCSSGTSTSGRDSGEFFGRSF